MSVGLSVPPRHHRLRVIRVLDDRQWWTWRAPGYRHQPVPLRASAELLPSWGLRIDTPVDLLLHAVQVPVDAGPDLDCGLMQAEVALDQDVRRIR